MTASERAQCATIAAGLRAASAWAPVAGFGAATAAAYIALWPQRAWPLAFGVLALALIERWYAFRLRLDQTLFAALAQADALDLAGLDHAMHALGLRRARAAERPLADRLRGARGLVMRHAAVVLAIAWLTAALLIDAVRH